MNERKTDTIVQRRCLANDTISRSLSITSSTPGASLESIFHHEQLSALDSTSDRFPNIKDSMDLRILNLDAFTAAREILKEDPEAEGKVAVLNLASDSKRAGGWIQTLSKTQEEALCYSSTLYETLKPEWYPWDNTGPNSIAGGFSPSVVVFRDDLDHDCVDLPIDERVVVSVITVAALRWRPLTPDKKEFKDAEDLEWMRQKIRLVYRMAARYGKTSLVLGAMGCGAYGCPPRRIAEEMKAILCEEEFKGWFKHIILAIYSKVDNGEGNFRVFREVWAGAGDNGPFKIKEVRDRH